jgi:hypothetical protein
MEYLQDAREAIRLLDERHESEQWIVDVQSAVTEKLREIDVNLKTENGRAAARMQEPEKRSLEIEEEVRPTVQAGEVQKTVGEQESLLGLWTELVGLRLPPKGEPRKLRLVPIGELVPPLKLEDGW